jgi:hypothetical protein
MKNYIELIFILMNNNFFNLRSIFLSNNTRQVLKKHSIFQTLIKLNHFRYFCIKAKTSAIKEQSKNITLKHLSQLQDNHDNIIKLNDKPTTIDIETFNTDLRLSKQENFHLYKEFLKRKEKKEFEKKYYKMKVGVSLFILLVGLFALWIPLYKVICESQGYSVKTSHADYKFDGRKSNLLY